LEIHHAAVRGLAADDYPASVIDAWAASVTDQSVKRFERLLASHDGEVRLIAECGGEPVGIGALAVNTSELVACYVTPHAARRGVGTALVAAVERIAREHHLDHLHLQSSVTAEPFYAALGYHVESRGETRLGSGVSMAAIAMRKRLE
jgi:putative acetyltransferase